MRGYSAIGITLAKREINVGGLMRSAHALGAAYVFTIHRRYRVKAADVSKAYRQIPLHHYSDWQDLFSHLPYDATPVAVEVDGERELPGFNHPQRAVYILGPEDDSIPQEVRERCPLSVRIPSGLCLNVATAGAIILYDRLVKATHETNN